MTNIVREFVDKLSIDECRQIHSEHACWERDGSIGDCLLRTKTIELIEESGLANIVAVTTFMNQITHEIWRRFSLSNLRIDGRD